MRKLFFLLILNLFLSYSTSYGQAVAGFINEVNYLASHPADRGLELAGEAGSDLSGWSVVVYLADGTVDNVRYVNNGIIPAQQNGYGTIWVEMEQGSGDGFAIVDASGSVAQFVSYGAANAITASEGAAAGLTSEFIGVQIVPEDAIQLTGTGLTYLDFVWSIPVGSTPEDINTNQVLGILPPLYSFSNDNGNAGSQAAGNQYTNDGNGFIDLDIKTYPNPTIDLVNLHFSAPIEKGIVEVYNLKGQLLHTQLINEFTTLESIDVHHFLAGQYLVKVTANDVSQSKIIVKL